jgi:hypothetical protein
MVTFRFVGPREIKGMEVDAFLVQYRRYDESWSDAKRKMWTKGECNCLKPEKFEKL